MSRQPDEQDAGRGRGSGWRKARGWLNPPPRLAGKAFALARDFALGFALGLALASFFALGFFAVPSSTQLARRQTAPANRWACRHAPT